MFVSACVFVYLFVFIIVLCVCIADRTQSPFHTWKWVRVCMFTCVVLCDILFLCVVSVCAFVCFLFFVIVLSVFMHVCVFFVFACVPVLLSVYVSVCDLVCSFLTCFLYVFLVSQAEKLINNTLSPTHKERYEYSKVVVKKLIRLQNPDLWNHYYLR